MNNVYRLVSTSLGTLLTACFLHAQTDTLPGLATGESPGVMDSEDVLEQIQLPNEEEEKSGALDTLALNGRDGGTQLVFSSRIGERFQESEGTSTGKYAGSQLKSSHRILLRNAGQVSGGMLFDKDPGEKQFNDFMGGFGMLCGTGPFRQLIFGNYRLEAGQGLAFWNGTGTGPGGDIVSPVLRKPAGLVPHLTTDESSYLSGLAMQLDIGPARLETGYSRRWLSATLDDHGNVRSLYSAGNFRTPTELAKRGNLLEEIVFGRLMLGLNDNVQLGISGARGIFSRMLDLSPPWDAFGNGYSLIGMECSGRFSNFAVTGEWVMPQGGAGGITTLCFMPQRGTQIAASFRKYPAGFQSLHGFAFRQGSPGSAETGLYIGAKTRMGRVTVSGYCDYYLLTAPTGKGGFSNAGNLTSVQISFHPIRKLELTMRIRRDLSTGQSGVPDGDGRILRRTINRRKNQFRIGAEYEIRPSLRLRMVVERLNLFPGGPEGPGSGKLVYHDLMFRPYETCRVSLRVAFFNTDSYETRMFEYERNLPGVFSLTRLYGRGLRWYVLVDYSGGEQFQISSKFALTSREDVRYLGSGAEQLPSNVESRIDLQMKLEL